MQERKNIYFRADGNTQIGLGHITRSMALADILKDDFYCIFLVQNPSEILQKQIQRDFELIILPETGNYLQEAQFIKETYLKENDIIVLDGYNFQTEYQKILKTQNIKLVCIDDMHAWHFVADAVINHAGGLKETAYSCENYTKLYLGTNYALLRKPFLEITKKERKIDKIEKVFICFGGADMYNLSQKAIEACLQADKFTEIHVVLGSAYLFLKELTNFAKSYTKVQIHQNLNAQEMCDLMQHCELAIVPASSVAYEVSTVGMYLIIGWYAENQKGIYQFLSENKLGLGADNFQHIARNIQEFIPENIYLKNQNIYFDSKLSKHLKSIFDGLVITCRKALIDDMKLYFDWTNEPEVRQNAINIEEISWETHQKWFKKKLEDKNSHLYIFEKENKLIGQVRIDINNGEGLISYSIDKKFRGLGFGSLIVQKATQEVLQKNENISFVAMVKKQNIASIKVFEKLAFSLVNDKENLLVFQL